MLLILVTVARSVELKHKPLVTSAVANETSKLFHKAGEMVTYDINFILNPDVTVELSTLAT